MNIKYINNYLFIVGPFMKQIEILMIDFSQTPFIVYNYPFIAAPFSGCCTTTSIYSIIA
jgi:hypothetical protein